MRWEEQSAPVLGGWEFQMGLLPAIPNSFQPQGLGTCCFLLSAPYMSGSHMDTSSESLPHTHYLQ